MKKKTLYKPFKAPKSSKKKMQVYVKKDGKIRLISFGQKGYKHNYSKKARESYDKRSKGIRDGKGNLTYNNKNTSNYWARKVLRKL